MLRSLLVVVGLLFAVAGRSAFALDLFPVCRGTMILGASAKCSIAWEWLEAGDIVASDPLFACGRSSSSYYTTGWVWHSPVAGYSRMVCSSAALSFASTYGAAVDGVAFVCGGTASNYYSGFPSPNYEARCDVDAGIVGLAGVRPDLFGLSSSGVVTRFLRRRVCTE